MEFLINKLRMSLNEQLLKITISNPRKAEEIRKYTIRPVLLREQLLFQMESFTKTQVFHENLSQEQIMQRLQEILPLYKQVLIQTVDGDTTALINKKGKASIRISGKRMPDKKMSKTVSDIAGAQKNIPKNVPASAQKNVLKNAQKKAQENIQGKYSSDSLQRLMHNKPKQYILQEGKVVPFLQDLGVMTAEGKIVRAKYDKFRQVNRFLEYIRDVLPHLPKDRPITILDFGCGKSYLTFAVYYYLKEMNGYDIRIIGLDLKKDVIRNCSRLAHKYGYENLHFYEGSIEEFEGVSQVDMVITLHACDTATDVALYKAIRWGAEVILSVPCCQHELNRQLSADKLKPVTNYGILKERFAAMATDAVRAGCLEAVGYETQILEFIDMEHTPKNLLIRAIKKDAHDTFDKGHAQGQTRTIQRNDDGLECHIPAKRNAQATTNTSEKDGLENKVSKPNALTSTSMHASTNAPMNTSKRWKELDEFCDAFGFKPTLKILLEKEIGQQLG